MVIDEDCPICKEMGNESEAGMGIWFYHLDTCNMDDEFAFSSFKTFEDWETEKLLQEAFHREFDRRRQEREKLIAKGEDVGDSLFDAPLLDEYFVTAAESDIPEA